MTAETMPQSDWQVRISNEEEAMSEGWEAVQETSQSSGQQPAEESIRFSDWQLEPYFDQPADTLSGRWYGKLASFGL